jgi:hypothetical protein
MLNSPRGFDINGRPIDWQEVKKRMLDHYGRDQISHAEELAAVPYVFDAATAREVLDTEEEIKESIRGGRKLVLMCRVIVSTGTMRMGTRSRI